MKRAAENQALLYGPNGDQLTRPGEPDYKPLEWPVVKKILWWMAPYKWDYAIALVVNLAGTLLDMLGPLYIKHLVDHDINGHPLYQLDHKFRHRHFTARGVHGRESRHSEPWF